MAPPETRRQKKLKLEAEEAAKKELLNELKVKFDEMKVITEELIVPNPNEEEEEEEVNPWLKAALEQFMHENVEVIFIAPVVEKLPLVEHPEPYPFELPEILDVMPVQENQENVIVVTENPDISENETVGTEKSENETVVTQNPDIFDNETVVTQNLDISDDNETVGTEIEEFTETEFSDTELSDFSGPEEEETTTTTTTVVADNVHWTSKLDLELPKKFMSIVNSQRPTLAQLKSIWDTVNPIPFTTSIWRKNYFMDILDGKITSVDFNELQIEEQNQPSMRTTECSLKTLFNFAKGEAGAMTIFKTALLHHAGITESNCAELFRLILAVADSFGTHREFVDFFMMAIFKPVEFYEAFATDSYGLKCVEEILLFVTCARKIVINFSSLTSKLCMLVKHSTSKVTELKIIGKLNLNETDLHQIQSVLRCKEAKITCLVISVQVLHQQQIIKNIIPCLWHDYNKISEFSFVDVPNPTAGMDLLQEVNYDNIFNQRVKKVTAEGPNTFLLLEYKVQQ